MKIAIAGLACAIALTQAGRPRALRRPNRKGNLLQALDIGALGGGDGGHGLPAECAVTDIRGCGGRFGIVGAGLGKLYCAAAPHAAPSRRQRRRWVYGHLPGMCF